MKDDLSMMKHPDAWPAWPFLPLRKDGPKCAFLIACEDAPTTLFFGNIFDREALQDPMKLDNKKYDSFQDILNDGWRVD